MTFVWLLLIHFVIEDKTPSGSSTSHYVTHAIYSSEKNCEKERKSWDAFLKKNGKEIKLLECRKQTLDNFVEFPK